MAWKYNNNDKMGFKEYNSHIDSFKINERCFIRKEHKCGKIFGASKSCFIACPNEDNIELILKLMSKKLSKAKIEPIIAVKERAYGQDIFCTKICGKIIESQFCIVILDDSVKEGKNIPNPNVYYEYGLMTALRKHIIPLQNEDLELAFNIQSYDTIKYKQSNIEAELDRAIKDAIKITESKKIEEKGPIPEKTILRNLELNDFELLEYDKLSDWILSDAIDDTGFKVFKQHIKDFYLYLGKIDMEEDIENYLGDLNVILYRTEKIIKDFENKLKKINEDNKTYYSLLNYEYNSEHENEKYRNKISELDDMYDLIEEKLWSTRDLDVGFIINPYVDIQQFKEKAKIIVKEYKGHDLIFSDGNEIEIRNEVISLDSDVSRII